MAHHILDNTNWEYLRLLVQIIQTTKQGTGFNQIWDLRPAGGTILIHGQTTAKSNLNVVGNMKCNNIYSNGIYSNGISVFDRSSTSNQYRMYMLSPTSTTPSVIRTIQQGVGYNQNLIFQRSGNGNIAISLIDPQVKLHVGGSTIMNNAITLSSLLNIVGNVIDSGTALTNLNYNAITNKPDLSV